MKRIMLNTKENIKTIENAFEEFQQFNKIKDLSEHTISNYERTYKIFTEFYSEQNLCNNLDVQVINEFIGYIKENRKISNISVNSYLRNIRAFVNYCIKIGYVEKSFKIPILKAEKKIKETYTDSEVNILLKKPNVKKCNFAQYRDWVFINYLMATGNRLSTIINIKIGDIDFDNNSIILKKTKNRSQQIIPISNSLKIVLVEYLKYRAGANEDYLFCTSTGTQLTPNSIKPSIRKYNRARGVSKTSIHLFRHTFAKNWILNGRRYIPTTKTIRP